jgi:hypothetical protein
MDFLEVIESVRSEDASIQKLFGDAGDRTATRKGQATQAYMKKLTEAAKFLGEVKKGTRPVYHLQEALSTSDFPFLYGDILDRVMLTRYQGMVPDWTQYAVRRTVRDFRPQEIAKPWMIGTGGSELEVVREHEEYPEAANFEELPLATWKVRKYGRRIGLSWEMIINDLNNELDDLPNQLARSARLTESARVAELFISTTGPNAALYNNTNLNLINVANGASANNPPLSISGLQDGLLVMANQTDEEGNPLYIDAVTLVVPPALEVIANNILNAIQIELTAPPGVRDSGSGETRLIVNNWLARRVNLVIDRNIPRVATTNGNTSWFLFAAPSDTNGAIWLGFLQGHETPELFIKSPNARRIGGGDVNPMDGDFDTDSIHYKVRHVLGSTIVDPRGTVASRGTGVV